MVPSSTRFRRGSNPFKTPLAVEDHTENNDWDQNKVYSNIRLHEKYIQFSSLFPPSGKTKQMRSEILNSLSTASTQKLVYIVPIKRLFNQFYKMFFKTLTFLLSANFKGILIIFLHNKSVQVTQRKKEATPK